MRGTDLTLADYAEHVGTTFIATDDDARPVLFELVEATPLAGPNTENIGGRSPFSLLFKCADQRQFGQATIDLTHPIMGTISLFVVPIGRDAEGGCYEATFN